MKNQIIERFPGIGCVWVNAAGEYAEEYFGFADIENKVVVDENTIFPACSISKFITALCVMKLHEQKLIDIDKPANLYLKQWKLRMSDGNESSATIRAILCHTAGILDGEDAFYGLRRGDPEITLTDILDGKTSYNNRPACSEKNPGTAFEYSDAGYCVLQLLVQEISQKTFEDFAKEMIFDSLQLKSTFFISSKNAERFENKMATGYDDEGNPIPGRFPVIPDLAASGLWTTPKELLAIAKAFIASLNGQGNFLASSLAKEMATPVKDFSWTGLGLFIGGQDILVSQGWGENAQCMLKMNYRTKEISIVMTNRNPGVDQTESGIEWLVNQRLQTE